jgi:hypothetical protein
MGIYEDPAYHPFESRKRRLIGDPRGSGLEYVLSVPLHVIRGDEMGICEDQIQHPFARHKRRLIRDP